MPVRDPEPFRSAWQQWQRSSFPFGFEHRRVAVRLNDADCAHGCELIRTLPRIDKLGVTGRARYHRLVASTSLLNFADSEDIFEVSRSVAEA